MSEIEAIVKKQLEQDDTEYLCLQWAHRFKQLYLSLHQKDLAQLAQGKKVENCLNIAMCMLPFNIAEIIQTEQLNFSSNEEFLTFHQEAIDNIKANVYGLAALDNSCGEDSNRLCRIFLDRRNIANEEYSSLASVYGSIASFSGQEYPVLFRFHLYMANDEGEFEGDHSFIVLAVNADKLYLYQSFFGTYSLAEWLGSERCQSMDEMSLVTFINKLKDIESENVERRTRQYNTLFTREGDKAEETIGRVKIKVFYTPVDIDDAFKRLKEIDLECQSVLSKNLELKKVGFTNYASEQIWQALTAYTDFDDLEMTVSQQKLWCQTVQAVRKVCEYVEGPKLK